MYPDQSHTWPSWPVFDKAELNAIGRCLEGGQWSRGTMIREAESLLAEQLRARYVLLVSSGTEALIIALLSLGIGPGDEVILPGLTWPATAVAVLECGAKAVVVDIDPQSYAISPEAVSEHITHRTKAIIAVHLYCSTADLDTLLSIANENGILLIEDAAQAHGCLWKDQHVGNFGRTGVLSFQEKKLITCGEGGAVITNDPKVFDAAYALRDHGATVDGTMASRYGRHSRLSGFCAAILSAQLVRFPTLSLKESQSGEYLRSLIDVLPGIRCLERRPSVTRQSFYNFCFRLLDDRLIEGREAISRRLHDSLKIEFQSTYPPLDDPCFFRPHLERRYKGLVDIRPLENCHRAYREALRFPHQYLLSSEEQLRSIGRAIGEATRPA